MKLKVGKTYKTRGGWKAIIVWESVLNRWPPFIVIHKPHTEEESLPIPHDSEGAACRTFSVNEPPSYDAGLPADLIKEWKQDEPT